MSPVPGHRSPFVTRLIYAMVDYRTFVLEGFLAFEAILMGAWIVWPGRLAFVAFTGIDGWGAVAFGIVMISHGLVSWWVLERRSVVWCSRVALASFSLWSFAALSLGSWPPHYALAVPLMTVQAGASLWVYFRLSLKLMAAA